MHFVLCICIVLYVNVHCITAYHYIMFVWQYVTWSSQFDMVLLHCIIWSSHHVMWSCLFVTWGMHCITWALHFVVCSSLLHYQCLYNKQAFYCMLLPLYLICLSVRLLLFDSEWPGWPLFMIQGLVLKINYRSRVWQHVNYCN